jgi:uncharacterized protein (TIGR03435 family)
MLKSRALQFICAALCVGGAVFAQAPATPAFEVVSIKPNDSSDGGGSMHIQPGGRFQAINYPVIGLIVSAFSTDERLLFSSQVVGGPDWVKSANFDIAAVADSSGPVDAQQFGSQLPAMLRSLLEQRFALKVHTELRQLPVYALVLSRKDGRLGPNLSRTNVDCRIPQRETASPRRIPCGMRFAFGTFSAGSITMEQVSRMLSGATQQIVLDQTGLIDRFDVELRWVADLGAPGSGAPVSDAPSIFAAVEEQLGLKLESTKAPVSVVVIDHVERPTPN